MAKTSNPALLLHELLSRWAEDQPTTAILNVRTQDGEWWAPHVHAVGWLDEVDTYLNAGDEQDDEEIAALNRLRRGILATGWNMQSEGNTNIFERIDLSLLRRIGLGWIRVTVDPSATHEMGQIATELLDLTQRADIDNESKRYLLELGVALKKALTELDYFGGAGVRALANQLIGALSVAFDVGDTDPDIKSQSVKLRKRLVEQAAAFGRAFGDGVAKSLGTGLVAYLALPPGISPIK